MDGTLFDGDDAPEGYVVLQPTQPVPFTGEPAPVPARWITEDELDAYLRDAERLQRMLEDSGVPNPLWKHMLGIFKAVPDMEPGAGFFAIIDFERSEGHLRG